MRGSINQATKEHTPDLPQCAVEVNGICKSYGKLRAVDNLSFQVSAGTIMGLVGPDRAGKTTLLRIIATMIPTYEDTILIYGMNVVKQRSEIKHLMGYMPQRFGLYIDLTVIENMTF